MLESSHMMEIILYVRDHDGCLRSDIYRGVSHNYSIPGKIDALEGCGLIAGSADGRSTRYTLTDRGARVASLLAEIREVLRDAPGAPPSP